MMLCGDGGVGVSAGLLFLVGLQGPDSEEKQGKAKL